MTATAPSGYTYDDPALPPSLVSVEDLERLKASVLFTDDDALAMAGEVLGGGCAESAPVVSLRYLIAFVYPITATMRPFLANKGHSEADVERMHQAWFKAVTLQVAFWARPYAVRDW